jgi:nickel-type superoxide dismutase maturation protease
MRRKTLRLLSRVPGIYACLAFLFARRVTVRGESMLPTFLPGERLLVDRLAYRRGRPRRGDIVLVSHPREPGLRLVKRLAGLPGEKVGSATMGRGEYHVEGDNALRSSDSREFGPVRSADILGRVWVRYWPAGRWLVLD